VLLDPQTGRLGAVIEAGKVNAYWTAAANAVAAGLLARKQAKVLTIFGAGNQAGFEVMALARIRPIKTVLVVARPAEAAPAGRALHDFGDIGLYGLCIGGKDFEPSRQVLYTIEPL
jgi:ornithine cyclodeaminase